MLQTVFRFKSPQKQSPKPVLASPLVHQFSINYFDENWVEHTEVFDGYAARIIQHEYDHIEGKLFVDKIAPIKKRLILKKLDAITKGLIRPEYKMKYPTLKKKKS